MADCECLDDSPERRNIEIAGFEIPQHIGAPKWRHVHPNGRTVYDDNGNSRLEDGRRAEVRGTVLPPPAAASEHPWHPTHGTRDDLKKSLAEFYENEHLPVHVQQNWATPLNLFTNDPMEADPMASVGAVLGALTIVPAVLWGLPSPDNDIDLFVWPETAYGRGHTIFTPEWRRKEAPHRTDTETSSRQTFEATDGSDMHVDSICCEVCCPKQMPFAPGGVHATSKAAPFGPWCPPIGHDIRVYGHLVLDMSHDYQTELHPLEWLTWRQETAEPALEQQYGGTIVCYRTTMCADVSGRFPLTRETSVDQTRFERREARGEQVRASITYEARDLAPKLSVADPTIECFLLEADSWGVEETATVARHGGEFLFTAAVAGWTGVEASNCNRSERDNNRGGHWDGWVVFRKPPEIREEEHRTDPGRRWWLLVGGALLAVLLLAIGIGVTTQGDDDDSTGQGASTSTTVAESSTAPTPTTLAPPPPTETTLPAVLPAPITAYFDQGAFSTFYDEPTTDPSWTYTWTLSIPTDPDCASGFQPANPVPSAARWFHADESEGGPCNHAGTTYDDVVGHPGTLTLVVRPTEGSWTCTMTFDGTAPQNQSASAPAVGSQPACTP